MRIKPIFTAIVIAAATSTILAESKTELLPEIKEILEVKFDEKNMGQNAYVALLAIDAPDGLDYKEIGKKVVIANNKQIREAIAKQDVNLIEKGINPKNYFQDKPDLSVNMIIEGEAYKFPCSQLDNHQCLAQLIIKQAEIEQLFTSNKVLLTRYSEVIKLPEFNTPPMIANTYTPSFSTVLNLSRLRLSEAVFLINKGEVEAGLDILQQDVTFAKRILIGKSALIDQMIASRQLLTTYHVISELLDSSQLTNQLNNPKLLALLKPLSVQEQQGLANAFAIERNQILYHLATYTLEQSEIELGKAWLEKEIGVSNLILSYDRNATLNMYYQKVEPAIKMAKITLPNASENYLDHLKDKPQRVALTGKEIYQQYGNDNFIGRVLVELALPDPKRYVERFYNLNNYLTLVNTKLHIKQANISKEQMPDFLVKLGEKAKNPYSKQSFVWNADTQTLSSEWLGDDMLKDDGQKASIYIQFNK